MSDDGTRRFGRFTVVATLGSGAMGEVLRARDERLGREVAIKTIKNVFGVSAELFRQRFEGEARALAALSHPAIVQVHDVGIENGEPYLVMELVDGPSLKEKLAAGPMEPAEVRALGIQLARALEAAHARGILHRDLKPANILLSKNGQWKLADFGVAHVPDSSMTMTGQFLGTPAYAAPEALALGQFSAQSDVFGAAAVLVEALTGKKMRGDASLSEIVQHSAEATRLPDGVPADLAAILRGALALDPARRPTAARLAELLASSSTVAMSAPMAIATPAVSAAMPATRRPPPMWWFLAGAGGLIVLIGIVAATSGGSGIDRKAAAPPAAVVPVADDVAPAEPAADPHRIAPPDGLDDHGTKDWQHIADAFNRGKYDDARKQLDKFEDRNGESAATDQLRSILDSLPEGDDEDEGPPGPPGKHGKHGR